jgi:uncharacterized protein
MVADAGAGFSRRGYARYLCRVSARPESIGFEAALCAAFAMQTVLIALLRFYKLAVSPLLGSRCRFYPSCSDYAREAIQYHGAARGTYLAAKRICRCHPFSAGGIDLVPPPQPNSRAARTKAPSHRI